MKLIVGYTPTCCLNFKFAIFIFENQDTNPVFFILFFAALPYSATLKQLWSALAATQSSAFLLVARPGSWRAALSGERVTKMIASQL